MTRSPGSMPSRSATSALALSCSLRDSQVPRTPSAVCSWRNGLAPSRAGIRSGRSCGGRGARAHRCRIRSGPRPAPRPSGPSAPPGRRCPIPRTPPGCGPATAGGYGAAARRSRSSPADRSPRADRRAAHRKSQATPNRLTVCNSLTTVGCAPQAWARVSLNVMTLRSFMHEPTASTRALTSHSHPESAPDPPRTCPELRRPTPPRRPTTPQPLTVFGPDQYLPVHSTAPDVPPATDHAQERASCVEETCPD